MKTTATVLAVTGEVATVLVVRTSACEGCHKLSGGGSCAVCSLVGGGKPMTARAGNRLGARVGDRVTVERAAAGVLGDAALVFLLPLLLCFLGWLIASRLSPEPLWQAVGAAAGLVCCFVGLRIYSGRVRARRPDMEITAILGPAERPAGEDDGQPGGRA